MLTHRVTRGSVAGVLVALGVTVVSGCGGSGPPSTPTTTTSPSTSSVAEDDWSAVATKVNPAVVRLSVSSCEDEASMASGFVVGPDLVMTAAHVVMGMSSITVQSGGDVIPAELLGMSSNHDTALLRTRQALSAEALTVADKDPAQGSPLAVIGYPLGTYQVRLATGIMSGEGEDVDYGDQVVSPVYVTDAATNGGNSGGPVVDHRGQVIGLVSGGQVWQDIGANRPAQGTNFIVPAQQIRAALQQWSGAKPVAGQCTGAGDAPSDDHFPVLTVGSDSPEATDIAQVLVTHGWGINTGEYPAAFSLFTSSMQRDMGGLSKWTAGLQSSYWQSIDLERVTGTGTTRQAQVSLVTRQASADGPDGQVCSTWHLDYRMVAVDGMWRIDHARSMSKPQACR